MAQDNGYCRIMLSVVPCFDGDIDACISTLPFGEAEKRRLACIKNKEYKESSLTALLCLQKLLMLEKIEPSEKIYILRTGDGKPYFASLNCFFSISHSNNTVAVALSDKPIGIDIEFVNEHRDILALSERFFAPEEHQAMLQSKNACEDFFVLWTKKEALTKIRGEGLSGICHAEPLKFGYNFATFCLQDSSEKAYVSVCRERSALLPTLRDFSTEALKMRYSIYELQI